jgi:hypothetical protein
VFVVSGAPVFPSLLEAASATSGVLVLALAVSLYSIQRPRRGPTTAESSPCPIDVRQASEPEISGVAARFASERMRATARALLGAELGALDRDQWHVEPDVILGGVAIPFVVFGPKGVFVLTAADRWVMPDLAAIARAARDLETVLAVYPNSVHAAICLPFTDREVRVWFDASGNRSVVFGRGRLLELVGGIDDRGYAAGDIGALRRATDLISTASRDRGISMRIGRG